MKIEEKSTEAMREIHYSTITSYDKYHEKKFFIPLSEYDRDKDRVMFMEFVAECEKIDKDAALKIKTANAS